MKQHTPGLMLRYFGKVHAGLCVAGLTALFLLARNGEAAIPAPEKLLPQDTVVVLTVPDFQKLSAAFRNSPQRQLWDDPAMQPFRQKFMSRLNEDLVKPLERELNVNFSEYTNLLQGQVTFALVEGGTAKATEQSSGFLLLLDAKDKSEQLKKNLAELRKKCVDAGRALKTEKIRGTDFSVLSLSSNDMPKTLQKLFSKKGAAQEGQEEEPAKAPDRTELVIGQVESLLIVGNSTKVVEKVVTRLTGGSLPALGDLAAYQANHQAMFREAPCYGWVNVKTFVDILLREASEKSESDTASPLDFKPEKLLAASGLAGLKTLAFNLQSSNEGTLLQFFLGVPEANRQGLFKVLAWETKESSAPPFVPADAIKFNRWRLDGQKSWAALEKLLGDVSPQAIGTLNFLIDSANAYAKEKEPGFDLKKSLIGNLGDDVISYEKAPRGNTAAELQSAPSLVLVGSPHPEEFAAALKSVLVVFSQQAGAPTEREFLGRKIFSVPMPPMPLPVPTGSKPSGPRTLSYAASGGYVALSTDASMVEEYLRSSQSQAKTLRETPGLMEAAQKVGGLGTGLFGYENQAESARAQFEALRKIPAGSGNGNGNGNGNGPDLLPVGSLPGVLNPQQSLSEWLDFSLLPSFDKVSKYFYFTVYAGNATADGLAVKLFAPVPPGLKK